MCAYLASILAFPGVGTSGHFFAPCKAQRQPLRKPRYDRGKMASHIVSLYLAFENQVNFSR
jgi:hypothetical protein